MGVFAQESLSIGTRLLVFGGERLAGHQVVDFMRVLRVGGDRFLGPSGKLDDYVNHSCTPNTQLRITGWSAWLVARAAIAAGDEITMDYSACMLAEPSLPSCRCAALGCRGAVLSLDELEPAARQALLRAGLVPASIQRACQQAAPVVRNTA